MRRLPHSAHYCFRLVFPDIYKNRPKIYRNIRKLAHFGVRQHKINAVLSAIGRGMHSADICAVPVQRAVCRRFAVFHHRARVKLRHG